MSRSLVLLPVLAAVLAACASSPQAAPAGPAPSPQTVDAPATPPPAPVAATPASAAGVYDFSTTVQGTPVTGVVTITSQDGRPGGSIATSATPEVPIKNVTVEGQTVTVTAESPDGEVVIAMTMEGQDFTGQWSYAGQSGTLSGRKR